jgi:hypothetical protein
MARKFDNQKIELPNGDSMTLGTWQGEDGEMCIKLRLPTDDWGVTGVFRAAKGNDYKDGKTVITLDLDQNG